MIAVDERRRRGVDRGTAVALGPARSPSAQLATKETTMRTVWNSFMLATALLAPACIADTDQADDLDSDSQEIVGGTPENIKGSPWMVSLFDDTGHHCAGSIIDARHVLTARHCFNIREVDPRGLASPKRRKVAAGMSKLSQISTAAQVVDIDDAIVIADGYDGTNFLTGRDVIVLRLAKPLQLNSKVQPIALATEADVCAGRLRPGITATATGWGRTSTDGPLSDQLLSVDLPLVSHEDFEKVVGATASDDILAAGGEAGKDTCSGDSGGPLVVQKGHKWIQAGIVSSGISEGCAVAGEPAAYTDVATYADLIRQATREKQTVVKRKEHLTGKNGDVLFFEIKVPAHQREVNFNVFGGTGDVDMRVRKGARPTEDDFDCKSAIIGPIGETCNLGSPAPGTYWVSITAFEDYEDITLQVNGYSGGY
jgi:secreted trypsin-like serine protease